MDIAVNPVRKTNNDEPLEVQKQVVADLFKEHNESLLNFLRTRLPSESDAHEVAQEAYIKLLKLDEPNAISYLKAYLFKIASNLAIDRLRHKQRRSSVDKFVFFQTESPSEEQAALRKEKVRMITSCIEELPPKCRKVFLLSRFHDLSNIEIANLMRISDRMVRKYLVRATEHCQLCLNEKFGDTKDDR
ncbi:RNA polymerase sigma-70 factor (ECF subfamily) [Alteromonas sp. 76-1]|jgi:RNA polymerase sigma factor (sigma-70 family)|uniref:RNA polymerase sigma factor n=1 Tax=Alteromonas sp. 76-1 TaxID=2358187 RepID=UPI000FD15A41|nr:RNA polymerase sigma factor [Alteromonas sp. 76-1]VEL96683.1 RNA polymerase sigma-70 factor (ECF subfamily) [Alteromonas sp. 76-1]